MTKAKLVELSHPSKLRRSGLKELRLAAELAMRLSDSRTAEAILGRVAELEAEKTKRQQSKETESMLRAIHEIKRRLR